MEENAYRMEINENIDLILHHKDILNQGFYRKLVEDSTDGHLLFNAETGRLIYLSMRSKDLLGYHNQNISDMKIWDFILNEEMPIFKERLSARFGGKNFSTGSKNISHIEKGQINFSS